MAKTLITITVEIDTPSAVAEDDQQHIDLVSEVTEELRALDGTLGDSDEGESVSVMMS